MRAGRAAALFVAGLLSLAIAEAKLIHPSGGDSSISLLLFGQSNIANMWENSNYALDDHTSVGLFTISSATYANFPDAILSPAPISGTNIPNGSTFTTDSAGANITIAPHPATGTTTAGTIEFEFPRIDPVGFALRYQGGPSQNVYPVADVPHADEGDYANTSLTATYGFPGATTAMANALAASYNQVVQFQMAIGGTPICNWVSGTTSTCTGAGSLYTSQIVSPSTGFTHNSLGISTFANAIYLQGEYEAINAPQTQAQYFENLQNIQAWVTAFPGTPKFMVAPIGNLVGISSDAAADAVVQAQLQMIDSGAAYFGSNMRVIPLGSDRHYTRAGLVTAACYMAQAVLKANSKALAGYGPKINQTSVVYDDANILTIPVTQETGTSLRSANQSTSGAGLTGFVVKDGMGSVLSYTSSFSGNSVLLAIGAQVRPITVSYLAGVNLDTSNPVYDDAVLAGRNCTLGLPLQPSRGPAITAG